tara:strand:+ start:190 stop:483 length:294 start_codon:yes stop_codon:yes gene_type:complete
MPSCHAEVNAIKYITKLKGSLAAQKATYICMRWSRNPLINDWELNEGNPCKDCAEYFKKHNINKFVISTKDEGNFKKKNLMEILQDSRASTGRLYGR